MYTSHHNKTKSAIVFEKKIHFYTEIKIWIIDDGGSDTKNTHDNGENSYS